MDYQETPYGLIPADWNLMPLGKVFEPVTVRLKEYGENGDNVPILSMTRSHGLVLQSEKFDKRVAGRDISNYKVVKEGQLVYGFPIDEGVIAILHRYPIGAVSPAYQVWVPIIDIDLTFIDYMLKTPFMINVYSMFSSNVVERRRILAQRDFIRIEVPLPSLPEQRAISHMLKMVRQSIEVTERVIAAARELKRSLMKYVFTYGIVSIDSAAQVKQIEMDIGIYPEGWDIQRLGNISKLITKGSSPRWQGFSYETHGKVFIRAQNVGEGTIELDDVKYLSESFNKAHPNSIIEENDLLITIAGTIGRTAIATKSIVGCNLNQAVAIIRINQSVLPKYVMYFLLTHNGQRHLQRNKKRLAQANISLQDIRTTLIPFPKLPEQERIITILADIDNKIQTEETKKQSLKALFNSLLHYLMTGKVRISNLNKV
jgi:type I restriction enzyme S subunit